MSDLVWRSLLELFLPLLVPSPQFVSPPLSFEPAAQSKSATVNVDSPSVADSTQVLKSSPESVKPAAALGAVAPDPKALSAASSVRPNAVRAEMSEGAAKTRAELMAYGSKSRHGMASVALSLQVLDAVESSSDVEFHERLARLPITISRAAAQDERGRPGIQTEYRVRGILKRARFNLAMSQSKPSSDENGQGAEGAPADGSVGSWELSSGARSIGARLTDCEYTDDNNVYWSGECATQQEIDDAAIVYFATESDANGVQADVGTDLEYCHTVLNSCWESDNLAPTLDVGYSFGGPSAAQACAPTADCTGEAILAGVAVLNYADKAWKLWMVVSVAAPPAGAVTGAVIGIGIGLAGLAYASYTMHTCINAI